jgi:hypothetical protein
MKTKTSLTRSQTEGATKRLNLLTFGPGAQASGGGSTDDHGFGLTA